MRKSSEKKISQRIRILFFRIHKNRASQSFSRISDIVGCLFQKYDVPLKKPSIFIFMEVVY